MLLKEIFTELERIRSMEYRITDELVRTIESTPALKEAFEANLIRLNIKAPADFHEYLRKLRSNKSKSRA